MALVFGHSPTNGDSFYLTFNNPDNGLLAGGFADTGARTVPVPERGYAGGAVIYGGVVSADGTAVTPTAPAPDGDAIGILSRSIARTRPASLATLAYVRDDWAPLHPGATVYVVHQ